VKNGPILEGFMKQYSQDGTFHGFDISTSGRRNGPEQTALFDIVREDFLNLLIANVESRFEHVNLLHAMQVLCTPIESEIVLTAHFFSVYSDFSTFCIPR
jgi:hypothetical protein